MGLHRDCARWNLDAKTVDRRRHLFWDLHTSEVFYVSLLQLLSTDAFDVWQSLELGRPPTIRTSYIDAELAADPENVDSEGNPIIGCKYQLTLTSHFSRH